VVALHSAIEKDHPNLQDPWLQATKHTSAEKIIEIAVGHCCALNSPYCKLKQETLPLTMPPPSAEAVLVGANHYYQYDLSVGSTPPNCVDVFSLGASGSNAAVTHAVFPVQVALAVANENHSIQNLDLTGPTLNVPSPLLSILPDGFNKAFYRIRIVTITCTSTLTPVLGKHTTSL
jgi:hypothetical protein